MKEFIALKISENHVGSTNQKIAVFELVEIEYLDYTIPGHNKTFTYKTEGEQYIVDWNSDLAKRMISKTKNDEIISLDTTEFRTRKEYDAGQIIKRHFHKNVII